MKRILPLSLLFLSVVGGAQAQTCGTTVSAYPYYQNFEAGAGGWTVGGTNPSWALGTPAKSIINSAASGTKSWVTSLGGLYNLSENAYVESPCFNTTGLVNPVIELKVWWNSEFSFDGAVLQSSIDNGGSWQIVGAMGDPNNWYNDNSINGGPGGQGGSVAQGWTGRNSTNNGSGGWVTARHALTGLGGKSNVRLRIAFASDAVMADEGFAFDDVAIFDLPGLDAAVTAISSPGASVQPMVSTPISVTVKNQGTANLIGADMGFSVNGTVMSNLAFGMNLTPGQTSSLTIGNYAFPAGIHTVKAWSKNPNGAVDGNPANDTASVRIHSCTAMAGTYTINKNTPASATNFQSFTAAAQALNNCGVSGSVTFNVSGGTYTETVTLGNINGASATNLITFNGNGNVLVNASVMADALTLNGTKYCRFNNLRMRAATGATAGAVVSLTNAAQHNSFTGCSFTHSLTIQTISQAVYLVAGSSYNTFQADTLVGGFHGIFNNGVNVANNTNNQFIGNVIRDSYLYGIYTTYSSNTLIQGNDISRPARTNGNGMYGVYLGAGAISTTVSKNRFHDTHPAAPITNGTVYGIYNGSGGLAGAENNFMNNVMWNIGKTAGTFHAFQNAPGSNSNYYYNTVSADNPNINYAILRGLVFPSGAFNIKFQNNNISLGSPAGSKHVIHFASASSGLICNNNNLYAGGTGNIGYFSTDKATLADWKATNGGIWDQNSVSDEPLFANLATGNLKPTNSVLDGAAQPITGLTDDINGATRSTTTPDIGAFEFTPAASDAGIVTITAPVSPVTPNAGLPVTVTLRNYGSSPLTAVAINWSVNAVAQPAFAWTGNLATNQSASVTIGTFSFPNGNHTLTACTANPNGVTDPNPATDCKTVALAACNPLAGTYTVNKNAAASGTNFTTVGSLISTLASCGISAPVTVDFAANSGPYTENLIFGSINGATATNTITINGNGNVIRSASTTAEAVVKLDNAKHYRFNNLNLEIAAGTLGNAVVLLTNYAQNNTFTGCTLTHSTSTTSPSQGVNVLTGSQNNIFRNNTIIGAYYGINIGGTAALANTGNQFIGNTIKDALYGGVFNTYGTNTLIEGNDISRPTRTNAGLFYGIYNSTGGTQVTISKNRIHNTMDATPTPASSVYGIYSIAPGTTGSENIVKNNAIYNINNTGGLTYAIYNSNASNTYYYNNTVSLDIPNANYNTLSGMFFSGAPVNMKFINNLISITSPAANKTALYLASTTIALVSNNNNLHAPGGNVGFCGGDMATLAAWKLVNAGAYDQASVSVDPVFVNAAAGDLRPTVVAVNNLGQPLTSVMDDLDGNPRNVSTPDMGAFEFSVNPNDVGVVAITGPNLTGCGLTATETISVTIKNFGTVTQTTFPVSYTLNGNTVTETWTGSMATNTTATHTFAAKANLGTPGSYTLTAATGLTGDSNAGNNADTLNLTNSLVSTLPYTFDFETAATGISRFRKVTNLNSAITEDAGASFGTGSVKGMILDGVNNANWLTPVGVTDPWTSNPDNFSAAYICLSPAGGLATDSLWLTFDLKQLFKVANANTNFRVTVNGQQIGSTYKPPFSGTPISWQKVKINLYAYRNDPSVMIGLESSVREAFANGTGTANLLDNISIQRRLVSGPTGMKENALAKQLHVFPNPSAGSFFVSLENGTNYDLKVTDLNGKVILKQNAKGDARLNLEGAAKGIYLLHVSSANGTAVRKLIVE